VGTNFRFGEFADGPPKDLLLVGRTEVHHSKE